MMVYLIKEESWAGILTRKMLVGSIQVPQSQQAAKENMNITLVTK